MDEEDLTYCDNAITEAKNSVDYLTNLLVQNPGFIISAPGTFISKQIESARLQAFYYTNLKRIKQVRTSEEYTNLMLRIVDKLIKSQLELEGLYTPEILAADSPLTLDSLKETRTQYEIQKRFFEGVLDSIAEARKEEAQEA